MLRQQIFVALGLLLQGKQCECATELQNVLEEYSSKLYVAQLWWTKIAVAMAMVHQDRGPDQVAALMQELGVLERSYDAMSAYDSVELRQMCKLFIFSYIHHRRGDDTLALDAVEQATELMRQDHPITFALRYMGLSVAGMVAVGVAERRRVVVGTDDDAGGVGGGATASGASLGGGSTPAASAAAAAAAPSALGAGLSNAVSAAASASVSALANVAASALAAAGTGATAATVAAAESMAADEEEGRVARVGDVACDVPATRVHRGLSSLSDQSAVSMWSHATSVDEATTAEGDDVDAGDGDAWSTSPRPRSSTAPMPIRKGRAQSMSAETSAPMAPAAASDASGNSYRAIALGSSYPSCEQPKSPRPTTKDPMLRRAKRIARNARELLKAQCGAFHFMKPGSLLLAAKVARLHDDFDRALVLAQRALRSAQELNQPYETALAKLDLARHGDVVSVLALRYAEEARATLQELGAVGSIGDAERLLSSLAASVPSRRSARTLSSRA